MQAMFAEQLLRHAGERSKAAAMASKRAFIDEEVRHATEPRMSSAVTMDNCADRPSAAMACCYVCVVDDEGTWNNAEFYIVSFLMYVIGTTWCNVVCSAYPTPYTHTGRQLCTQPACCCHAHDTWPAANAGIAAIHATPPCAAPSQQIFTRLPSNVHQVPNGFSPQGQIGSKGCCVIQ
jgi:hypothetical protein